MRVIVTGATGFLGAVVCELLRERGHEVVPAGLSRAGRDIRKLDITSASDCTAMVRETRPLAIVHLAALVNPDLCERDRQQARRINVDGTTNLARAAPKGTLFALASTDYVFDGEGPPYDEESPKSPINVYGRTKGEAEEVVIAETDEHLILRLPLLYSAAPARPGGLVEAAIRTVKGQEIIELDDWQVRCPTLAQDAARALELLVNSEHRGCFHLSAGETTTKFQFAMEVAAWLGLPATHLVPCKPNSTAGAVARPRNCRLETGKFAAAGGFEFRSYPAVIPQLLQDMGLSARKQASPRRGPS